MFIVSIIWGVAAPVIKFTLHDFPPLIFLSYRFAISSIIALIVFSVTKERFSKKGKAVEGMIGYSLLAVPVALGLLFFGFDKTTSLTGNVLTAMTPMATVIAGVLLLREHVTGIERTGLTLAFAGTLVIIFGPLWHDGLGTDTSSLGSLEGNLLVIAAIIIDALSALLVKTTLRTGVSASSLTHLSFLIGFLAILPFALVTHGLPQIMSTITSAPITAHLGVWYMAILSGTLAYWLRNQAIKSIEVSEAVVFTYLYPLWAAPLSVYWLGEKITTPFLLGGSIIAVGVIIAEHKKRRNKKKR
ncbi:hypothetical protein A3A79_00740 [Candidatus Gottesmanbacteria bacterium RIFCSPLOWO2_01_FULL_43_11b]|uniref:EamA domain-containing protein n=1 Tax=Candidatus Gottesmanbacteria bacterium RIFCSPLOWO2_01_FULL_43_11b TaxID=1798392 RepID=A0A1F6AG42_9BACT|nr:MAG: hypothetical protein A3A79_00740 [Candidatus Gottesmanbacteria bacterium RIFCSPLOWO2_01_FULL_43_11b]